MADTKSLKRKYWILQIAQEALTFRPVQIEAYLKVLEVKVLVMTSKPFMKDKAFYEDALFGHGMNMWCTSERILQRRHFLKITRDNLALKL